MKLLKSKSFANGTVYALMTEDGFPVEVTDTFLPFYTKDAIGRKQNTLSDSNFGSRKERWMVGISCMSGCPVRCKFCFDGETLITLDDFSYKKIKDINIGDNVIANILTKASTPDSQYTSKYTKSTKVVDVFSRWYSGDMIKISTKNGNIITCTPEHPIAIINSKRIRNKFEEAKNIKIGDFITSSENIIENKNNKDWLIGWFVGFVRGDGVFSKNSKRNSYKWTVSQSDKDIIEFCYKLANDLQVYTTKIWEQKSKNNKINYRFSFGEKSIKIFNSLIRDNYNDDYKRGYLAGFWDAEGFSLRNNKSYRVCGANYSELHIIKEYLEYFGFKTDIKLYKSNKAHNNVKDLFVLESNLNRIHFCSKFNPLHNKKIFLRNKKTKIYGHLDEVINICRYRYDGMVFNIETENNTYYANNVLVHNCATGQLKKYRNLTALELVEQVEFIISQNPDYNFVDAKEHKINWTRMGEPFLNIEAVKEAISIIDLKYPGTHHYISTIGVKGSDFSWIKDNITLQVSLHSLEESRRNNLIPFKNKMTIEELGKIRTKSNLKTTVNLTLVDDQDFDINKLQENFDRDSFFIKLSPINKNSVSNKNNMGDGIVAGINLV